MVLIPFLCNKLTASIYPLKINEYLAAGKTVVSTNFSEDIRSFGDVIEVAKSDDEFVQLINKAIAEDSPEKVNQRIEVAESNTWEARVAQFWQLIAQHKPAKNENTVYKTANI